MTKTSEPCMCGDTACPTCGTLQGTFSGDDSDELLLKRGKLELVIASEPGQAVVELWEDEFDHVVLGVGVDRQEAITRTVELLEAMLESAQGPAPGR